MIATLDQLKLYLWISWSTQDSLLTLFLNWANDIVETYIGRKIEDADYTQIIDGNGQLFYVVENYPINTITSVSRNIWTIASPIREVIDSNSYSFIAKTGVVNFLSPLNRGFKNYKIIYNAWYATIPNDLIIAVCKLAGKYFNTRTSDWVSSESVIGDSISYDTAEIPNDILVILSNYRNV